MLAALLAGGVLASTSPARRSTRPGPGRCGSYYGTDTRLAEPLVGALLAVLLAGRTGRALRRRGRRLLDAAAVAALAALAVLLTRLGVGDDRLYAGGFLLTAALTAVVLAAVTGQASLVGRLLGARPLAAVGRVSYGLYLFHWPVFLWLDGERTGLAGPALLALRVSVTGVLAVTSFVAVERPVRAGRLPRRAARLTWVNAGVATVAALAVAVGATGGGLGSVPGGSALASGSTPRLTPPPAVGVTAGAVAAAATAAARRSDPGGCPGADQAAADRGRGGLGRAEPRLRARRLGPADRAGGGLRRLDPRLPAEPGW